MPRHARLDVPGTLHHVMVRGDRGERLATLGSDGRWKKEDGSKKKTSSASGGGTSTVTTLHIQRDIIGHNMG